jgi:hypothetical protein
LFHTVVKCTYDPPPAFVRDVRGGGFFDGIDF